MSHTLSSLHLLLAILSCGAALAASDVEMPAPPPEMPIPINVAEAIIEPFWDRELSGLSHWTIAPRDACALRVYQEWNAVYFEWTSSPTGGPVLEMNRDFHVDCGRYDVLMLSATCPKGCVVKLTAHTNLGERALAFPPSEGEEHEYRLPLDGAQSITQVTIAISGVPNTPATGWLRWVGLQNTGLLDAYSKQWDFSRMKWEAYLKPTSGITNFAPRYGIFLTSEELDTLRKEHRAAVAKDGASSFSRRAEAANTMDFESAIHEFANTGGEHGMHGRDRDADRASMPGGPDIATAALVTENPDALHAAGRFALSLAMSPHWEYGFMAAFPGSSWEDRPFRRSYCAQDIAEILDLAGEAFTDAGRTYLMRRLAEEGVGPINYALWRHEYVFHCNQLAYFNNGRTYAYLVLERQWPRVKPYTDLALNDTLDNLATVILPDGGYDEGPSYFSPVIRNNYKILTYYARSRGRTLAELVPATLANTANFAAVVVSTTPESFIPICDAHGDWPSDFLEMLHQLFPNTYWTTLCNRQRVLEGLEPLAQVGPPLPAFVALPDMGPLASTRVLGSEIVKILVMGGRAGATHTHEDKGSFALEFAGETFAMDPGICDYKDPIHLQYKYCQRHNMLVPVVEGDRPRPQSPLAADVKPTGSGDETRFHASIDATPGWDGFYTKWTRTWDSPSPDSLTIRDDYALAKGDAVEFYWQTQLPATIDGNTITITGKRGVVTLSFPEDCTARIDTLPMADSAQQTRIAIRREGKSGRIDVTVRLEGK